MLGYLKIISEYSFLLGVFFLPVYQTINHWFFGMFIGLTFVTFLLNRKIDIGFAKIGRYLIFGCVVFFLLRLITILYASEHEAANEEMLRALPFILYPIGVLSIKNNLNFNYIIFEKKVFWALVLGCTLTALLCWGNIIINIEENPLPENQLFGWKKSGSYLTSFLDLHPPYLGMLICAAILFLFKETYFNSSLKTLQRSLFYLWIIFLLIFLFNLTSRNTLFFIVLVAFVFFIVNKLWKFVAGSILICLLAAVFIVNHPSEYYRLKMYHMLGFSDNEQVQDKRFKRLEASYNVFKTNPIFGVGVGIDTKMKIEEYRRLDEKIAESRAYNSHNQFFEYLTAYGIIGGLVFISAILYFILFLIRNKYYFYLILFLNIVFATLTESVFERVLGIQYYSIIISLALMKSIQKDKMITE